MTNKSIIIVFHSIFATDQINVANRVHQKKRRTTSTPKPKPKLFDEEFNEFRLSNKMGVKIVDKPKLMLCASFVSVSALLVVLPI